jgi:hypothetical protein
MQGTRWKRCRKTPGGGGGGGEREGAGEDLFLISVYDKATTMADEAVCRQFIGA